MEALVITAAVIGYAVWAYFHPYRPCPRCQGKGVNRGSTKRRSGRCGRCHGEKQVKTIGSKALHRAVRSIRGYHNERKSR